MVLPFGVGPGIELFRSLSDQFFAVIPQDRKELAVHIDKHAVIHPADCNGIQAGFEGGAVTLFADSKDFLRRS